MSPIARNFGSGRGTPIDRYYIDDFLKQKCNDIKGSVLEIAENTYSKRFGIGVEKYEILHINDSNINATIIGDLCDSNTLPEKTIDCFICTQTFNFIYDFKSAIQGSYKLLNEGGVLLGTVAGLSQISRYDMDRWGDYWRFSNKSIQMLLEETFGVGNVETLVYGNVFAATALLKGDCLLS